MDALGWCDNLAHNKDVAENLGSLPEKTPTPPGSADQLVPRGDDATSAAAAPAECARGEGDDGGPNAGDAG